MRETFKSYCRNPCSGFFMLEIWMQTSALRAIMWIAAILRGLVGSGSKNRFYLSTWLSLHLTDIWVIDFIYPTVWAQRKIMLLIWTEKIFSVLQKSLQAPCVREHDRIETYYAKCGRENCSAGWHVAASLERESGGTLGAVSSWLLHGTSWMQERVKYECVGS